MGILVIRAASANPDVTLVANDPFMLLGYTVYQVKYYSVHGRFEGTILKRMETSSSLSKQEPSSG